MEIKFYNVKYQDKIKELNITIRNNKINGIYNCNELINILNNPKLIQHGAIYIDNDKYKKNDNRSITVIDREAPFYTSKVIDEIYFYAKIRNYKCNNIKKEIINLFEKFEIDKSILDRICHSLSQTEKYYVKLVANLITNPKIIIFKDILNGMDLKNKKIMKKFLEELKEQEKLIILTSNDSNILYELTEEVFIFNKGNLITSGNTFDIYTNVEILLKNKVDVPYFSLLTYKANNEKGANLFYRKDVRDVIKDVYKSVS